MNHPTVTVGTVGAGYAARLHGSGYARVSGIHVRLKTICRDLVLSSDQRCDSPEPGSGLCK